MSLVTCLTMQILPMSDENYMGKDSLSDWDVHAPEWCRKGIENGIDRISRFAHGTTNFFSNLTLYGLEKANEVAQGEQQENSIVEQVQDRVVEQVGKAAEQTGQVVEQAQDAADKVGTVVKRGLKLTSDTVEKQKEQLAGKKNQLLNYMSQAKDYTSAKMLSVKDSWNALSTKQKVAIATVSVISLSLLYKYGFSKKKPSVDMDDDFEYVEEDDMLEEDMMQEQEALV